MSYGWVGWGLFWRRPGIEGELPEVSKRGSAGVMLRWRGCEEDEGGMSKGNGKDKGRGSRATGRL